MGINHAKQAKISGEFFRFYKGKLVSEIFNDQLVLRSTLPLECLGSLVRNAGISCGAMLNCRTPGMPVMTSD
jgi:hypothetical protein